MGGIAAWQGKEKRGCSKCDLIRFQARLDNHGDKSPKPGIDCLMLENAIEDK